MPPLLSHPGGERHDESRLYAADIQPRGPYLRRTPGRMGPDLTVPAGGAQRNPRNARTPRG